MRAHDVRPDSGYVLASVIWMMAVLLLVMPMVLAATMQATGWATAARAAVQARAAAEAGIDVARAAIAAGGTWCGGTGELISPYTDPSYDVVVYSSSSGPATASGVPSCPLSAGAFAAESVLLVSTGRASTSGVVNSSGDTQVVEARLDRSVPGGAGGSVASGRFPYTVTARDALTGTLSVAGGADGGAAAVAAAGPVTCDVLEVEGTLHVGEDLTAQSTDCHVHGDLVVGGDLVCHAGMVVEGDLHVTGSARFESDACEVHGVVVVSGDVLLTAADVRAGSLLSVGGDLEVQGLPDDTTVVRVDVGGSVTGPLAPEMVEQWAGWLTTDHPSVAVPEAFPHDQVHDRPGVRADDADLTEEFVEGDWLEVLAAVAPGQSGTALCQLMGATNPFSAPLVINQATRYDTREACPSGISLGQGLHLSLGADVVIVANGIAQTGDVQITATGVDQHSLYLVDPWPEDPAATCGATGAAGIDLAYGTWAQGPGTAVLLSTSGVANLGSAPVTFAGQVDACTVSVPAAAALTHASVSDSAAIDTSVLAVWDLAYVRDRS